MSVYVPDEWGRRVSPGVRRAAPGTKIVRVDDLAGVSEVAEGLAVTKRTVMAWAKRDDFPGALTVLSCGPVYSLSMIRTWHRGRLGETEE